MGAVAPVPWRSVAAERALAGKPVTEAVAARPRRRRVAEAKPHEAANAYKVQVARTAVKRAILKAGLGLTRIWDLGSG